MTDFVIISWVSFQPYGQVLSSAEFTSAKRSGLCNNCCKTGISDNGAGIPTITMALSPKLSVFNTPRSTSGQTGQTLVDVV